MDAIQCLGGRVALGDLPGLSLEGDGALVEREAVEVGAVDRGEGLEPVECSCILEDLRVHGHGHGGAEDAGAAAGTLLGHANVWGAVRAGEELGTP